MLYIDEPYWLSGAFLKAERIYTFFPNYYHTCIHTGFSTRGLGNRSCHYHVSFKSSPVLQDQRKQEQNSKWELAVRNGESQRKQTRSRNVQVKAEKLAFDKCNSRGFQCIHNELSHSEGNILSMAIHLLLTRKQISMCPASQSRTSGPFVQSSSYKGEKSRFE